MATLRRQLHVAPASRANAPALARALDPEEEALRQALLRQFVPEDKGATEAISELQRQESAKSASGAGGAAALPSMAKTKTGRPASRSAWANTESARQRATEMLGTERYWFLKNELSVLSAAVDALEAARKLRHHRLAVAAEGEQATKRERSIRRQSAINMQARHAETVLTAAWLSESDIPRRDRLRPKVLAFAVEASERYLRDGRDSRKVFTPTALAYFAIGEGLDLRPAPRTTKDERRTAALSFRRNIERWSDVHRLVFKNRR